MQSTLKNRITSLLLLATGAATTSFGATIPQVNRYKVTIQKIFPEPSAAQFSISAQDQVKVSKPS